MLFGVGAANMISMRLGEGRKEDAEKALTHCVGLLIISGVMLTVLGLIFIDPILSLMGAQENSDSLGYAKEYLQIILFGYIFSQVGFGLSHCSRAQGFPKITMIAMLLGAILNTVLDPIFIFVFHMGVRGAALATIISQLASCIWVLSFNLSKKAVIRINPRKIFHLSGSIVLQILTFGSAQFLLQLAASAVQIVMNTSLAKYGLRDLPVDKGGDLAISAMGIIGSIQMLILMPVFGINQGAQPVLGFNYGAKKYGRVRQAYLTAVLGATIVCTAGFLLGEIFPVQIVKLFANTDNVVLLDFAQSVMRVILIMMPLIGFQIVSANMFVVTGRPKISIVLSMLRQVIVLIPCLLLFGWLWGLDGVIRATPVADGVAIVVTAVLIFFELKKLKDPAPEKRKA
jgi:putative MATE family efflux protein